MTKSSPITFRGVKIEGWCGRFNLRTKKTTIIKVDQFYAKSTDLATLLKTCIFILFKSKNWQLMSLYVILNWNPEDIFTWNDIVTVASVCHLASVVQHWVYVTHTLRNWIQLPRSNTRPNMTAQTSISIPNGVLLWCIDPFHFLCFFCMYIYIWFDIFFLRKPFSHV